MSQHTPRSTSGLTPSLTRRRMLQGSLAAAASAALTDRLASRTYAGQDSTIRLALIGCGGRGSGAALNALSAPGGPVKLYAMADLFPERLESSRRNLARRFPKQVDVPPERRFIGFDAYKKAIDCLGSTDVAMLTAYSYCRPTHFEYAVRKGVNVFMEKSFAPDSFGSHRMLKTGQQAQRKGLKVAAGLMCRHSRARQALIAKIRDGELGDIIHVRSRRLHAAQVLASRPPAGENELLWQIRNKWHFMWTSSGQFIEWLIHQIDEICWIKGAWPVAATGLGGRVHGTTDLGQDLHLYGVEYIFPDGTRSRVDCRFMNHCQSEFTTYIYGAKAAAHFSGPGHQANSAIFKDQHIDRKNIAWAAPPDPTNPWQAEWNVLLDKIRNDQPHNETERAIYANFASLMGRAACHTGQLVKWEDLYQSDFRFCDYVDELSNDSPPPVQADASGQYPVPVPGQWREY